MLRQPQGRARRRGVRALPSMTVEIAVAARFDRAAAE
jgi:hypothetical protein